MSQITTCPGCHRKNEVDESMIGRFVRCDQCRCLYYVVVPPLGEERREWTSIAANSSTSGHVDTEQLSKRPESAAEILNRRLQVLTLLMILNLLIGSMAVVLAIILIRK